MSRGGEKDAPRNLRPSAAGAGISFQLTVYDDSTIAYRGADADSIASILRLIADHAEQTHFAEIRAERPTA